MKKVLAVLISICIIAGLIGMVGCESKNSGKDKVETESNATNTSETQKNETAAVEKADLVLWATPMIKGFDGKGEKFEDWSETQAKRFIEKNPNITIKVEIIPWEQLAEKTNVAISANSTPDIMEDSNVRAMGYAGRGKILPLDDAIAEVKDDIYDYVLKSFQINGVTYVAPVATSPDTMIVNKTIFEEAGALDYLPNNAERTWTFDEFLKALKKVNKPSKKLYGTALFAGSPSGIEAMLSFIWSAGTLTYNEDGTKFIMNDENSVKGLEFLKKLNEEGVVAPGAATMTANNLYDLFYKKQIAVMICGGAYAMTTVKTMIDKGEIKAPFETMLVNYPHAEGRNPVVSTWNEGWFAFDTKDAIRTKWAKEFIKFAMQQKDALENFCVTSGQFTGRKSIPLYNDNTEMVWFGDMLKFGYNKGEQSPKFSEIRSMIFPELQAALTGTKTAKQALDDLAANANKALSN